jgi:hypothetical protein
MQEKNAPARKIFLFRCPENTAISSLFNTGLPLFMLYVRGVAA